MITIQIKFRALTTDSREGNIYYRIAQDQVEGCWDSDYRIYRDEWDFKKSKIHISKKNERRAYLISTKERIKWDTARFKRIILDLSDRGGNFGPYEIIEEFSKRKRLHSFFNFMEASIVRLKELGKRRTSETYISAFNSFRRFRNDKDLLLDDIDSELMESYEVRLKNDGLIPNSRSFHMRILRAVYNRAIERGLTVDKHPFKRVYTGVDKTTKRAVDIKTVKKIKEIDLDDWPDADFARDMFMLSFYMRGMSFIDMAFLRKTDLAAGKITYRRRKTGQQLSIMWTAEMQDVLDRYPANDTEYLLPIITSGKSMPHNQYRFKQYLVNKGLKKVAECIGLGIPLTMYCSRHSWASIARAKGIPLNIISDGLGHDNELTTRIYLSTLDTKEVDRANALILKML